MEEDHEERHTHWSGSRNLSRCPIPPACGPSPSTWGKGVPFSLGLSPFYLNPAENASVALSDRPEFAKALRYAVSKGGTVVLHGCTHQYRGPDDQRLRILGRLNDAPCSRIRGNKVRQRIDRRVDELRPQRPIIRGWETPH